MKVVAVIQARMSSTRLPGKVLQDVAGEPMLARVVQRTRRAGSIDETVVAATVEPGDAPIAELCAARGWPCFRGSLEDVLDRYYQAARSYQADAVVRITSDCPLIDPGVVDEVVTAFLERQPQADYASNVVLPRTYPRGLDTEVMSFAALERAALEATDPASREHVTRHILLNPQSYRVVRTAGEIDYSEMRWTVDTEADLRLVRLIYEHLDRDDFDWHDVIALVQRNPRWSEINRHIVQKAT
jgi:spore coat polysaccharide biosynthesis protein SpsF